MKMIKQSEVNSVENSDRCKALEYAFGDSDLNLAETVTNGRYPETGYLVNEVSKEIAYVLSGSGKIGTENEERDLKPGDAVFLSNNEKFYWIGDNMRLLVACNPAFDPEQHKEIE